MSSKPRATAPRSWLTPGAAGALNTGASHPGRQGFHTLSSPAHQSPELSYRRRWELGVGGQGRGAGKEEGNKKETEKIFFKKPFDRI